MTAKITALFFLITFGLSTSSLWGADYFPEGTVIYRQINWKAILDSKPGKLSWRNFLEERLDIETLTGLDKMGLNPFKNIKTITEYVFFEKGRMEYLFELDGDFNQDDFQNNLPRSFRNFLKVDNFQKLELNKKEFYVVGGIPLRGVFNYLYLESNSKVIISTSRKMVENIISGQFKKDPKIAGFKSQLKSDDLFYISGDAKYYPMAQKNLLLGFFDNDKNKRKGEFSSPAFDPDTLPAFVLFNTTFKKFFNNNNSHFFYQTIAHRGKAVVFSCFFDTSKITSKEREDLEDFVLISSKKNGTNLINVAMLLQFERVGASLSMLAGEKPRVSFENFLIADEKDEKLMDFFTSLVVKAQFEGNLYKIGYIHPWRK